MVDSPGWRRFGATAFLFTFGLLAAACGASDKSSPTAPSTAVKVDGPSTASTGASTGSTTEGAAAKPTGPLADSMSVAANPAAEGANGPAPRLPMAGPPNNGVINFPPRNEPNLFFFNLQVLYRDVLRRPQTAPSYVDPEGENVWLTEYFRFYLNGCTHETSVARTIQEIITGVNLATCGVETPTFPPRNLPNAFQAQLEATYRDILRRPLLVSYVDSEGANVWLAEYLRYRISGCDHFTAEARVFTQIRGGGVQPACSGGGGGGGGGGTTLNLSGTVAPRTVGRHIVSITGSGVANMRIRLSWSNPGVDLDLYASTGSCGDPFVCTLLGVSDASSGTTEETTIDVRAGGDYAIWVANFSFTTGQNYNIVVDLLPGFRSTDDDIVLRVSPMMPGPAIEPSRPKLRDRW